MVLEITLNARCVKPKMKQSLTLFLSALNFFEKNINNGVTDKTVHGDMCRKNSFNVPEKWYERKPLPCIENEPFKILWDFDIQMDRIIEQRRPDMII